MSACLGGWGSSVFLTHFPKRAKAGRQYVPEHGDSLGDAAGNADGGVEMSSGDRQKRMAEREHAETWIARRIQGM